ncbi:MAG: HigA family addiction module antidote protein [Candidatus Omnitrophica bacterium]|nr:HigA family addiction module antidote protein [Candidatus Omnitrophota bacterium]
MIATSRKTTIRLPQNRPPVHPGEIMAEEYMLPYNITQQEMAVHLKISRKHLIDIIHGRKPISLEIAQRLAKLFRTSIEFWFQGQMAYDLWHAVRHPSRQLRTIKPLELNIN